MNNEAIQLAVRELQLSEAGKEDSELIKLLTARINELIQADFHQLVSILYRMDVSEEKLKRLLQQHPQENAADLITALIIERQAEKIKSKKEFKQSPPSNEEEAW